MANYTNLIKNDRIQNLNGIYQGKEIVVAVIAIFDSYVKNLGTTAGVTAVCLCNYCTCDE